MARNWSGDLKLFEDFLLLIPIDKYAKLRSVKTVEQDLPPDLRPLELFYRFYWDSTDFKSFDEIFDFYWKEKLAPIMDFIKKFFYGCSISFVEEGMKARIYRTWMSLLTQYHFQYLWNSLFDGKLESSAVLDGMGIDALYMIGTKKIGIQIKKISFRREVSDRRFTNKQKKQADIAVEVPYLVIDLEDLKTKIINPRTQDKTKTESQKALVNFHANFIKLPNGFVIFKKEYLRTLY
jgi:hypothetical protein